MKTYKELMRGGGYPSAFDGSANFASFDDSYDTWIVDPALTHHRDSDTLTESNWRIALERLGGESETVAIIRTGHWAVGWVEQLAIAPTDKARLVAMAEMVKSIAGYPVLSEDDWSKLRYEKAADYWSRCSISERVQWCQDYGACVFAARRNEIPRDRTGELVDALAD